jgi:hypothetical protein
MVLPVERSHRAIRSASPHPNAQAPREKTAAPTIARSMPTSIFTRIGAKARRAQRESNASKIAGTTSHWPLCVPMMTRRSRSNRAVESDRRPPLTHARQALPEACHPRTAPAAKGVTPTSRTAGLAHRRVAAHITEAINAMLMLTEDAPNAARCIAALPRRVARALDHEAICPATRASWMTAWVIGSPLTIPVPLAPRDTRQTMASEKHRFSAKILPRGSVLCSVLMYDSFGTGSTEPGP